MKMRSEKKDQIDQIIYDVQWKHNNETAIISVQPSSSTQSILSPFCNLDSERGGGSPVLNGLPRQRS